MSEYKVVHLSPTPLVGAPAKISKTLCDIGINSSCVILRDYPPHSGLSNFFISHATLANDSFDEIMAKCECADIIHIHNDIPQSLAKKLFTLNHKIFIYQVHSPLREGPLYYERSKYLGLDFSKKLVVAQYQPRLYPNYTLVPNITLYQPCVTYRKVGEPLKVMFSPSHKRGGRWNIKVCSRTERAIEAVSSRNDVEVLFLNKPEHPNKLFKARCLAHVTIDEVLTGAYHQVSLEGLCAGNIVFNRADYFSKISLRNVAGSENCPPFIYTEPKSLESNLIMFAENVELTNALKRESKDYYSTHLLPNKLIGKYVEIYQEVFEKSHKRSH
ncbi:hypothetical protein [Endozoicomonas sp. 8E]|uniref:hypothetical protein n=1 Tax=Endozoicomonas sp. 8E TaxID=3035692 RepID=UPI002938F819|nr:hypothetical protein [Endozoicomonas sp. 8E]WOG29988.1 hypothetical protein P6910_10130 [Endozoicomonas sp. 8E]